MTILNQEDSIVLIIDIQEKLLNAVFNKAGVEKKSEIISKTASILDLPVYVTEQYPKGLGSTVNTIAENLNKDRTEIYEKTSFNALFDLNLQYHFLIHRCTVSASVSAISTVIFPF